MAEPTPAVLARFWAKVEKTEGCWMWTGCRHKTGYGGFRFQGKVWKAHRVSYVLNVGPLQVGQELDHICGVRACVRPSHLRIVTRKQNNENHSALRKDNSSGMRGVSWHRGRGKWQAKVRHNRRDIYVGIFDSLEEAAEAARLARLELFTHNEADRRVA